VEGSRERKEGREAVGGKTHTHTRRASHRLPTYTYTHSIYIGNVNDLLTESLDYAKYAGRKVRRPRERDWLPPVSSSLPPSLPPSLLRFFRSSWTKRVLLLLPIIS